MLRLLVIIVAACGLCLLTTQTAFARDGIGATAPASLSMAFKWRVVQARIAEDAVRLAACRAAPDACDPAGKILELIIDRGRARHGRARIGEINRSVNLAVRPVGDMRQFGVQDLWLSPLETLESGTGDCEDYAILKYLALREAGWPAEDLKLLVVHDPIASADHAVLAAWLSDRWLMLDNRNFALADLEAALLSRRYRVLAQLSPDADVPDEESVALLALYRDDRGSN